MELLSSGARDGSAAAEVPAPLPLQAGAAGTHPRHWSGLFRRRRPSVDLVCQEGPAIPGACGSSRLPLAKRCPFDAHLAARASWLEFPQRNESHRQP
jgi:hypothetical protein